MSFPPYEIYKSTEYDWLGTIPAFWKTQKFRHLFKESSEKIEGEVFGEMLSVSGYRGIERKEYDDENRRRSDEDLVGYRIVRKGQLVVNTMWLNYAGLGFSELDGHVSPAYRAYWPKSDEYSKYLHYLLRSEHYVKGYTRLLTGVRPNSLQMSRDNMMSFPIVLPPKAEQIAISTFLDHETAKIDALIAEQQRLIELLQEKRQAVISHAVTKGLNPDAPMKDSGVEWLGEVPEHWEVMGLTKTIGPVVDYRGKTPTKSDEGTLLVTAKNIRNGEIDYTLSEEYVDPLEAEKLLQRGRPVIGDVLFTMEAPLGQVALVDREDIALAQRVVKFRGMIGRMTNDFLMWWLVGSHCQHQLNSLSTGSTALGIKASKLSDVTCVVPPLEEQIAISERIRDLSKQITGIYSTARSQIDLLQERRSALISAAVTGQIDVRNLAEEVAA